MCLHRPLLSQYSSWDTNCCVQEICRLFSTLRRQVWGPVVCMHACKWQFSACIYACVYAYVHARAVCVSARLHARGALPVCVRVRVSYACMHAWTLIAFKASNGVWDAAVRRRRLAFSFSPDFFDGPPVLQVTALARSSCSSTSNSSSNGNSSSIPTSNSTNGSLNSGSSSSLEGALFVFACCRYVLKCIETEIQKEGFIKPQPLRGPTHELVSCS